MKKYIFGLFCIGLTAQVFSQTIALPEVEIAAVNYKYLNEVENENIDMDIKLLHEKVALYDLKNSDLYRDEYDIYTVSFYIPDGKILAAYDKNGKVIRTVEKFNNFKLPKVILNAIAKKYPNWIMAEGVYRVNYHDRADVVIKKQYKIKLAKGDDILRVKLDEKGEFVQ